MLGFNGLEDGCAVNCVGLVGGWEVACIGGQAAGQVILGQQVGPLREGFGSNAGEHLVLAVGGQCAV